MKTQTLFLFSIMLFVSCLLPTEQAIAHGDHDHDEHKEEMILEFLTQTSIEIKELQNNSELTRAEKILKATDILIASLPHADEHVCSGGCQHDKSLSFKKLFKQLGRSVIKLPVSVAKTIYQGISDSLKAELKTEAVTFNEQVNRFLRKLPKNIDSFKRKGLNRVAELWQRHGMLSTFFIATIIGVTYPPYTAVTEILESMLFGPAHMWCTFFQVQYLIAVTYSLKHVDTFKTLGYQLKKNHLFTPFQIINQNATIRKMKANTTGQLDQFTRAEQITKMKKIATEFIGLNTKRLLKEAVVFSKDLEHNKVGEQLQGFLNSPVIIARLWHDNLMFMGESLRDLIQHRYDEAIEKAYKHPKILSTKKIDREFREILASINQYLRSIHQYYSRWVAAQKDDPDAREALESHFIDFTVTIMSFDPDLFEGDIQFQETEKICHSRFK